MSASQVSGAQRCASSARNVLKCSQLFSGEMLHRSPLEPEQPRRRIRLHVRATSLSAVRFVAIVGVIGVLAGCVPTHPLVVARTVFDETATPQLNSSVEVAVSATQYDEFSSGGVVEQPDRPGRVFLAVHISYRALVDHVHFDRGQWVLLVDRIPTNSFALTRFGPSPELFAGELLAGQSADGWLVYEIPPKGDLALWWERGLPLANEVIDNGLSFEITLKRE